MQMLLVLLTTFLVTPVARGRILTPEPPRPERSLAEWTNYMFERCVEDFRNHLDLPPAAAAVVAERLCGHERIFWPFVEVRDVRAFEKLRGFAPTEAGPLMISLTGWSSRLNSQAMHAIRRVLYPASPSLVNYNDGPRARERWVKTHGRFGGVVYVTIDATSSSARELQLHRARAAVTAMASAAQAGFVLIIDARSNHPVNLPGGLRISLNPCESPLLEAL